MFKPCLNQELYICYMVSLKVILFKSKTLKNGEHPIMLRFIKDRKIEYISIGKSCSEKMWDKKSNLPKTSHPLFRDYCVLISNKKLEAEKLLLDIENNNQTFSKDEIKNVIRKKGNKNVSVF